MKLPFVSREWHEHAVSAMETEIWDLRRKNKELRERERARMVCCAAIEQDAETIQVEGSRDEMKRYRRRRRMLEKKYGFSLDDFRTLAQGIQCRMNNPAYPDTFVEVVEQPGQWPGYSDNNEVTQKSYKTALQILAELDEQEHPPITSDFVFASFEKDGITLRNTWEISTKTHFWRYGE